MHARLRPDATGLTVIQHGEGDCRIEWQDVRQIQAYKVDLFSYDEIFVEFQVGASGELVRISESDAGFKDLLQALEQRFSVSRDTFIDIAFPPFATNLNVLYPKAS